MKRFFTIFTAVIILALIGAGCQQTAVTSAKVYIQQGQYEKALEQCQLAVNTNSKDPAAWFIMGQTQGLLGNYREMNDAFTKSLNISALHAAEISQQRNKYYVDLFNIGASAIKNNEFEKAKENFTLCTEMVPEKSEAFTNLALVYSLMKEDSLAILTYKQAIEKDPSNLEVQSTLGIVYYRNKMYDEAIEVLQGVVDKSEPGSDLYNKAIQNIAYSYDLKDEKDKAIEIYTDVLKINPDNADTWFNLGRLYYMQAQNLEKDDPEKAGIFEKAIDAFLEVIRIAPDDFDSNLNAAQAYLETERWEEGIPYYEKAVDLNPLNQLAWNNLGVCYVRTGNMKKGQAAFDMAESINSGEVSEIKEEYGEPDEFYTLEREGFKYTSLKYYSKGIIFNFLNGKLDSKETFTPIK
ncbi:tetratricopeptide repeat protein [candidate division KSB1 bacterium]|nr:tetratricopeptide repeat protein [candidate division KSB1 bacterium]